MPTSFRTLLLLAAASASLRPATVEGVVEILQPALRAAHRPTDVVVWLEPPTPPLPSGPPAHARLLQKNKTFHPHVLVVRTGTVVDFPNEDPIFHNAFSTYDGQLFDVGLYPPGTNRSVRFRRPGVVRVFCNIHPSMAAVIVVLDTPYFTTASAAGEYRIPDVQPGTYRLNVYDERATGRKEDQPLIEIASDNQQVSAPPLSISEAGWVPLPHKNKYGREYPPGSENPGYDGVMR